MNTLLILGFGHCTQALVSILPRDTWRIIATTRSTENAIQYTQKYGCDIYIYPNENLGALITEFPDITHIIASAPPTEGGDPFLPLLTCYAHQFTSLCWFGYLSTIGVYAEENGNWIDETAPILNSSPRISRRIEAEQAWQSFANTTRANATIFRLGSIYGAHSHPFHDIMAGTAQAILKQNHVFNRIHVKDVAGSILAIMNSHNKFQILNIVDGQPTSQLEYVTYAAHLLKRPAPPTIPFEQAELSRMRQEFYSRTKRVLNKQLTQKLGYSLKYPSYREGLQEILNYLP